MNTLILKKIKSVYRNCLYYEKLFSTIDMRVEIAKENIENTWRKKYPIFSQKNVINQVYDLQIIISAYNTGVYLKECIQSFLQQKTNYTVGIVIVNDGSTDNTVEVLKEYQEYENIKIIHQENRGFSGARNRALENICGEYVMFLDSDDVLPENAIESLMKVAIGKDADIVAGGYSTFTENGLLKTYKLTNSVRQVLPEEIPGFTCMKVIRSKLLSDFCFPEGFLFEDTVLSKLVYPKCRCVYVIPDIVYNYRAREGSISLSYNKDRDCIDTFWITKYCLEESIKQGYSLDETTYKEYLKQCYINYLRTRYLSQELQESLFVLTAEILNEQWKKLRVSEPNKFKMLDKAIKKRSFAAYRYVLERWELL